VAASGDVDEQTAKVLLQILAAEISPELVPAGEGGVIQSTEHIVGPYELQDFNLFYVTRYGFRPSKIAYMAHHAWSDAARGNWPDGIELAARRVYDLGQIKHWLGVFLFRFFTISRFKRSAVPNEPKISPRGDWRAPSDGNARV
jgi:NAD+ synthase (glutamine-hydrolysing)